MLMPTKVNRICLAILLVVSQSAFAGGNVTINNNNSSPATPPQPTQPQCGGNQNNVYDPRVPPAGSYVIHNNDGSSDQLYTTGEKKPYYVDNSGCNNSNVAPVQPYAFVGGGGRGPGPGPRR